MKFILLPITLLLLSFSLIQAQDDFNQGDFLNNIAENILLPWHEQLVSDATDLNLSIEALAQETNTDNLLKAQEEWRKTVNTWRLVAIFGFRDPMIIHSRINKIPAHEKFIEEFIAGDETLDVDFIHTLGATSVGLPAIEYLLFAKENPAELNFLGENPRRMDYLVALGGALVDSTTELLAYWSPEGQDASTPFTQQDQKESINMLANEMIESVEKLISSDLAGPMGLRVAGEPNPEGSHTWRSEESLTLIRSTLSGVQAIFNGADGPGFDDYLDKLGIQSGDQLLSERMNQEFDTILTQIDNMPFSLERGVIEDYDSIQSLYDEIRVLIRLMKVDMASQLGITVTFSDADGD